jgi:preprotein translocase subunit Sss1
MFEALVATAVMLFFGLVGYLVYLMSGIRARERDR